MLGTILIVVLVLLVLGSIPSWGYSRGLHREETIAGRSTGKSLEEAVADLVDEHAAILSEQRRTRIRELILRDTIGLGPLEELIAG